MTTKQLHARYILTPDKATSIESGIVRVEISSRKIYIQYVNGAIRSAHYAHRDLTYLFTVQEFENFVNLRRCNSHICILADGSRVLVPSERI